MFDFANPAHDELREFLHSNLEALQNASLLLGGKPALKATCALIEEVCDTQVLNRKQKQGLVRLHELLSLAHVHNPNRPEAAYFAELDPAAPYVEDICLLSDTLMEIMRRLDEIPGFPRAA
jgi:hypothetical protein